MTKDDVSPSYVPDSTETLLYRHTAKLTIATTSHDIFSGKLYIYTSLGQRLTSAVNVLAVMSLWGAGTGRKKKTETTV